ncbi:MAG: hypothetical protein LBJ76_04885 [Candidatus Accumulibacter sp.]|jgi:hypothetical protein|nr:hypothetical protein [Accumulibacter sp.]
MLQSLFLVFCLYFKTLRQMHFADDYLYLSYDNHLLREAPWTDLYKFFLVRANAWEFLPLRDFTYWLDFRLFGDTFSGFHFTNLIWYALSIGGAYFLFHQLILLCRPEWGEKASLLSLVGALFFAAHPAHVEAVAWVASRKELVAGSLVLFSLALLTHAVRNGRPWREIIVSAFLLFLAYFGKGAAVACVIFAGVLLCVGDQSLEKNTGRNVGKFSTVLLFFSLAALACAIHIRVGADTGIRVENHLGIFAILDRASRILSALLGILLFPYPMRLYYDVYQYGAWHWLVSGFAVIAGFGALRVLIKRRSLSALGVVLALSPMLVYLQFIPFGTWSLAGERFVFVSIAGLSLMGVDILGRFTKPRAMGIAVAILIFPCMAITWMRIDEWGRDGIYDMLDIEYGYQPNFHVVLSDRISPRLMLAKRYGEARSVAQGFKRPYAADAMLRYIDTHEAYTPLRKLSTDETMKPDLKDLREKFCVESGKLRESIRRAREQLRTEPDVSYYYIIQSLAVWSEGYDDAGRKKMSCKPGNS